MRNKDEEKQAALVEATVQTVNAAGFAAASVSKIAKAANVSPATLYVYYTNKEDLLVSTYIEIKKAFSQAMLADIDTQKPIRDVLKQAWMAMSKYISENSDYFRFADQFSNSPYHELVDREQVEQYFAPIIEVLHRGIAEKIIKDVDFDVLTAFMFYPVMALTNPRLCANFETTPKNIEIAFNLAWDAIRR